MNLCECGCGEEVKKNRNRFINGHNSTAPIVKQHISVLQNIVKLCECGCGQKVKINEQNGTLNRFILGHGMRHRKHKPESIQRCRESHLNKHSTFKHDEITKDLLKLLALKPERIIQSIKNLPQTCLEDK